MKFTKLVPYIKYNASTTGISFIPLRFLHSAKSTERNFDFVIIGGGIIGVTTARKIILKKPHLKVAILEKEPDLAMHQTGHNSGVIHAGIYYKPGSAKALLCRIGLDEIYAFCNKNNIPYKKCGKIIVAVNQDQLPTLEYLYRQGIANDVPDIQMLNADGIKNVEPHCSGIKAIYSPHTGITDYSLITKHCAKEFISKGGSVYCNFKATSFEESESEYPVLIKSDKEGQVLNAKYVLACTGLYSDTVAVQCFGSPEPKIVPFRGEYLLLSKEKQNLVKGNIYPVPDIKFPFLGVHFTPRLDGSIWIGPNAVLAFAREGYKWSNINYSELWDSLQYSGFRKLARKYCSYGINEILNSLILKRNVAYLQQYIPDITINDISRGPSGVRAQAIDYEGNLVDDFELSHGESGFENRIMHCRNTPSPSATSCFPIAHHIYSKIITSYDI